MDIPLDLFEKPIQRIKTTRDLMGVSDEFERKLPELETYLEALVAKGETDEEQLAVNGLKFLKQARSRQPIAGSSDPQPLQARKFVDNRT